jgi:hypothetical protein
VTLWKVASIAEEPEVRISRWRIIEISAGTKHFVGVDQLDLSGRFSSAIVVFDSQMLRGQTVSGRVYQLMGVPGRSDNADYVWQQWCAINEVESFSDVTGKLFVGLPDDNPQ